MREVIPSIRPYADDDMETLVAIEQASFPNAWSREMLAGWIQRADTECRVIEQEGRVVGFFLVVYEPEGLHIANLAVDPDFLRRGLALGALEGIDELAEARRAKRVALEVRETNLADQLLYRKAGYRAVDIMSDYYRNEDAYRMVMRFGNE